MILIRYATPGTILLPGRNGTEDVSEMVAEPDWNEIETVIGFPCILKPVDGYAWQDVFKVADLATLRGLFESLKERRTLIVQELISYVGLLQGLLRQRARGVHRPVGAAAIRPGRVLSARAGELGSAEEHIRQKTMELNASLGLDFNAVEWCITTGRDASDHRLLQRRSRRETGKTPAGRLRLAGGEVLLVRARQAGQRGEKSDPSGLRFRHAHGLSPGFA